jgi:small ligand-binding sensory domain FIST
VNQPPHSVVGHWSGPWDEEGLVEFAADLRRRLGSRSVTFGLIFLAPELAGRAVEVLELVRVHARVPVLAGCSSLGLVVGGREIESATGLVLALHALPGARAVAVPFSRASESVAVARHVLPDDFVPAGWLAFLEPFHTDSEDWIEGWQAAFPHQPVYGGLATGSGDEPIAQVYCDGRVLEAGGVALGVSGIRMLGAVAQGCTPVGETWTITRTDGNVIHRIGNRPAVAVLSETFESLDEETRQRSRGGLFAGLAVDEYVEEHERGDFLVRNLIGADSDSGALAVAASPRSGQTIRFQIRDAAAADEELRHVLGRLRDTVGRARVYGGCLSVCLGRGRTFFGESDHDAALVRQIVGPVEVGGFFGAGEFGPVGSRSWVHGYTASLVLFVGDEPMPEEEL